MPLWLKKTVNITSTSLWNWHAFFWPRSHSLWWLGFCFRVVPADPRFITGNCCLHEVSILISTLQQISGYYKVSRFLLACQHFWEKFCWDTFHAQIFCQKGLYRTKWKPQLVRGPSNCYSSTAEHTLSVISWFYSRRASLNIQHSLLLCVPLWTAWTTP